MIDKRVATLDQALEGLGDGASVMVGGFAGNGAPTALVEALVASGVRDLTVVSNGASAHPGDIGILCKSGAVRKLVCSFPRAPGTDWFDDLDTNAFEIELVPQGTLAERIRAGGAGIPGFYTPTGVGTPLAEGKEAREIDGETCLFETAIRADFALIRARRADRWGNLVYGKAGRNFNPVMATAAEVTIAEVTEIVELGAIDPEAIVTPGLYVDRVLKVEPPA